MSEPKPRSDTDSTPGWLRRGLIALLALLLGAALWAYQGGTTPW